MSGAVDIDPSSYPGLGDEELGQLRWVVELADRPLDDFRDLEGIDQLGMTSYRYAIAFMTYFMAVEQYHKLPAAPELLKPRIDRFIQKIIQKPVWEFWAEVSRGVPTLEPDMSKPYPEERDPVGNRNIMYSGHVAHMIGLYETLYRDFKWEQPGAITFEWSPTEKYVYDYHSLNQTLYRQMRYNPDHCIECEPNACFPECNQHPILSFMLYDSLHGTHLMEASEYFLDFFLKNKMIDPRSHETAMLYLVKQKITVSTSNPRYQNLLDVVIAPVISLGIVSLESGSADGWTGTFMHAWQKQYLERHYPYQKAYTIRELDAERAKVHMTVWEPQLKYGFFGMYAAEMGDYETRDQVLNYADEKYQPVGENGTLRYPYSSARGCNNLTGKLIALARALSKDGMWKLHNQPFDELHFQEPKVTGIDYPRLVLRRAIYDREKRALVISAEPGNEKGGASSFRVVQLDPGSAYRLFIDGKEAGVYQGQGSITMEIPLDGRHDLVLVAR